jgi:hypothetical protein
VLDEDGSRRRARQLRRAAVRAKLLVNLIKVR